MNIFIIIQWLKCGTLNAHRPNKTPFLYVIKTRRIHFTIVWHRGKQKQKKTETKQTKKQKTNKNSCSSFVFAQSTYILPSFILIENRT